MFGGRWRKRKSDANTAGSSTQVNGMAQDGGRTSAKGASSEGHASASSDLRRLRLRFVGQVQGVGFRWTSQRVARSIGLTGWVKNEWDGSVSMELQGTQEQISRYFGEFQNQYRDYPIRYTIDQKDDIAPVPNENRFDVKY